MANFSSYMEQKCADWWQSPFETSFPAGICCCCGCCLQKICSSAPSASPPSAPSAPKKKEKKEKKSPLQPRWNQCALTFYSLDCNVFHISAVIRWTNKNPGAQTTTTGEKTHSSMTMLKTMIICHRLLLPLFPSHGFKKKSPAKRIRLLILYSTFHPPFEKPGCILSSKLWSVGTNSQERNNLVTGIKVRANTNRAGGVELNQFLAIWWWSGHQGWYTEEVAGLKQCQCLFLQSWIPVSK